MQSPMKYKKFPSSYTSNERHALLPMLPSNHYIRDRPYIRNRHIAPSTLRNLPPWAKHAKSFKSLLESRRIPGRARVPRMSWNRGGVLAIKKIIQIHTWGSTVPHRLAQIQGTGALGRIHIRTTRLASSDTPRSSVTVSRGP